MSNPTVFHPKVDLVLKILLSGCIYYVLAILSLYLQFQSTHATPVWPSSGFALAIMLLWGYRVAPGILLGAFFANLLIFRDTSTADLSTSLLASIIIALGNVSESLLGTYLIRKVFPEFSVTTFFEKVTEVFKFVLIAIIICLVSSTIGSATAHISGLVSADQYLKVLITWWLGDFAGILLVTTLIIIWIKSFKVPPPILYKGWRRQAEIVALYAAVIISSGVIFDEWIPTLTMFKWAYLITPVIVWAAIRFNQREFITAVALHSVIAIWGTINRHGPFGGLELNDALIALQSFISILVITKLVLNASVLTQRKTEKILRDAGSVLEYHVKNRTTELEERNRFVETLIDNSPYMILAYDKDYMVTAWNKKSEDHTGIKKDQILGKYIFDAFPEYLNEKWMAINQQVLFEGKTLHFPKVKFEYKQGWGESFVSPLINTHGEIIGLLSITNEITNLVDITSVLEKKNEDLVRMNEELTSFAFVASHDLQEPLRKIQIFSKRISETDKQSLSDVAKDYLHRMNKSANRMQLLIENLLTYSRAKNADRKFETTSIQDILDEVKEELKEELAANHATIEAEELCTVNINAFQFRQLLHNLISNSIKFSNPDVHLRIKITSNVALGKDLDHSKLDPEKNTVIL
jgi:PAS domain S-box-containing protein